MSAPKTRTRAKGRATTAEDALAPLYAVAALDPDPEKRHQAWALIRRAALASMAQSETEAAYERAIADGKDDIQLGSKANDAQRETCAAGAALAKALRAVKVPS